MPTNEVDDASAMLSQARARMTRLAMKLQQVLTPIDAVSVLAGAAVGLLQATYGRAKAAEYFAELSAEIAEQEETIQ